MTLTEFFPPAWLARYAKLCVAGLLLFLFVPVYADGDTGSTRTLVYRSAASTGPAGSLRTVGGYPVQPEGPAITLKGFSVTALPDGKVLVYGADPVAIFSSGMHSPKDGSVNAVLRNRQNYQISGSLYSEPLMWNPTKRGWEKVSRPPECPQARLLHTSTVLPKGKVLIAGGLCAVTRMLDDKSPPSAYTKLSLWDSATQKWESAPSLAESRIHHSATLLKDGSVLIAGGESDPALSGSGTSLLGSVERYHDGKVETLAPMRVARARHSATLLADGKALVVGGVDKDGKAIASVEIWDPSAQRWRDAPPLKTPRYQHSASLLADGRLMIAGGIGPDNGPVAAVEILNPEHDAWIFGEPLLLPLQGHAATRLSNGNVLVMGGTTIKMRPVFMAMLWEKESAQWRPAGFTQPGAVVDSEPHPITLVPSPDGSAHAFSFPWIAQWLPAGRAAIASAPLYGARENHTTTLLRDGRILIAGGRDGNAFLDWTEVFDPDTNRFAATARMHQARHSHTAIALDDGRVVVAGGWARAPDRPGQPAAHSPEVWNPETGQWGLISAIRFEWQDWVHLGKLADGRVLFLASRELAENAPLGPVEYRVWIWHPKTGHVETRQPGLKPHGKAVISILPDGRVLRVGGNLRSLDSEQRWNDFPDQTAEIWNSQTGDVTRLSPPPGMRAAGLKSLLLKNGNVLLMDYEPPHPYGQLRAANTTLWNAQTGAWKSLPPLPVESEWPVMELKDGTLISKTRWLRPGAEAWSAAAPYPQYAWPDASRVSSSILQLPSDRLLALSTSTPHVAYFDEKSGQWRLRANRYLIRENGRRPVLLPLADGKLLVSGHVQGREGRQPTVQLWNPKDDTWTATSSPSGAYAGEIQATQLASGSVMQVGQSGNGKLVCEIWQPADDSWKVCGYLSREKSIDHFQLGTLEDGRAGLMIDANDVLVYGGNADDWRPMKVEWNSKRPTYGAPIRVGDWVARIHDSKTGNWIDASTLASRYYAKTSGFSAPTAMFWHPTKREYSYVLRITSMSSSRGDMGREAVLLPDDCVLSVYPPSVFNQQYGKSKPILEPVIGIPGSARSFAMLPGGTVVIAGYPEGASGEGAGFFHRRASCAGFELLPGDEHFMPGILADRNDYASVAPTTPLPTPDSGWVRLQNLYENYKWLVLAIVGPILLYLLLRFFVQPRLRRRGVVEPERKLVAVGLRVLLYGLAAYYIVPAIWSYIKSKEGVDPRDCAEYAPACVDKETKILSGESALEKSGAAGSKPDIPCRYVGIWSSTQGSRMYRVTLKDDGTYVMDANEFFGGQAYSGYWVVQGNNFVWRHMIGNTGEADINPILPENDKKFTLVEGNGKHTQFELITRLKSNRCAQ